ncbi:MAG: hypothetical protein IJJ38_09800, partial [Lachnospiraceae bacterium]|nr:hypothetical protein [Lachnospiraceae bacterium]
MISLYCRAFCTLVRCTLNSGVDGAGFFDASKGSGSSAVLIWSQKVDRLMGTLVNVKVPDVLIDVP